VKTAYESNFEVTPNFIGCGQRELDTLRNDAIDKFSQIGVVDDCRITQVVKVQRRPTIPRILPLPPEVGNRCRPLPSGVDDRCSLVTRKSRVGALVALRTLEAETSLLKRGTE
jgi:hypothetical protein